MKRRSFITDLEQRNRDDAWYYEMLNDLHNVIADNLVEWSESWRFTPYCTDGHAWVEDDDL